MSAAIGSALAGARTMTATSSQGLALMAEVVYIAAAMRAPIVMGLGNRALSGPINIHCDHSDSMLVRDSGAIQLFAENAQEAYDLMVLAPRLAEHPDVLLPVLVCQDGFTITHSAEPVGSSTTRTSARFVGDYRDPEPAARPARSDHAGAVRDARLVLRAAAPAGGGDGGGAARLRRARGGARDAHRSPAPAGRAVPPRRRGARRRLPRLDGRDGEGRRRRAARPRRAGRAAADPLVPAAAAPARSAPRCVGVGDRRRARPGRLAGRRAAARRGGRRAPSPARRRSSAATSTASAAAICIPTRSAEVFRDAAHGPGPATSDCEETVSRLKNLVRNEPASRPCAAATRSARAAGSRWSSARSSTRSTTPVVVVSATGCLEVATTRYPTTAWNVPWLHVAFENAAAVVSGVETAYRALARRGALPQDEPITFVALAGDGGTYDIGLQALSGALERGHRFVFVCYDNEAYMNTGVQRSGRDAVRREHDHEPGRRRGTRQGAAAEGHDRDRGRAPHPLRRAGRRRRTGTTSASRRSGPRAQTARRSSTSSPTAPSAGATSRASPPRSSTPRSTAATGRSTRSSTGVGG